MVVYDYKWPTLAQKLYYAYCLNKKKGAQHGAQRDFQFNVINFVDVSHSRRVNPIQRIDFPALIRMMREVNYTGMCSLEYEKDMKDPFLGIAESIGYFKAVSDML